MDDLLGGDMDQSVRRSPGGADPGGKKGGGTSSSALFKGVNLLKDNLAPTLIDEKLVHNASKLALQGDRYTRDTR